MSKSILQKTPSEVYFAHGIGNSGKSGIGRQILPTMVSHEDWEAAGAIVRDEPVDAHAVSVTRYSDPVNGMPQTVERDFWSVHTTLPDGTKGRFEVDKVGPYFNTEQFSALAGSVEQHLGKTGLTILVS